MHCSVGRLDGPDLCRQCLDKGCESFQVMPVVKNPPASEVDAGSILGSGRSRGGGHGNPLQYSCLENPVGRGAWWATPHGVAKSWKQTYQLNNDIR